MSNFLNSKSQEILNKVESSFDYEKKEVTASAVSFERKDFDDAIAVADYYESQMKAIDEEIKRLQARKKEFEVKRTAVRDVILNDMLTDNENVKTALHSFVIKETEAIEVADDIDFNEVPKAFVEVKKSIKKADIKAYLKTGNTVKGVIIKRNKSLVVK